MNRREFVAATIAAGSTWLTSGASPVEAAAQSAAAPQSGSSEYYELRRYRLLRGPQTQLVDDYWRQAALPALQRAGVGPVGVFNVMIGANSPSLYVLIVHPNLEGFASLAGRLAADADYQKAGDAYLNAPATSP